MDIQWFPGHMTKARRAMAEDIRLVDAVCELIDARLPSSSRNPDLPDLLGGKPRILVLNRIDQADPDATAKWSAYYRASGERVIETDCRSGKGVGKLPPVARSLLADKLASYEAKGQSGRGLRVMVVGIPNVGKSAFINAVAKRKAASVADRPGVTRGRQWIRIDGTLELMDTPGVLWPKFGSRTVGENLAFTGAVRDETMDIEELGASLMLRLRDMSPKPLAERCRMELDMSDDGYAMLDKAAAGRGFLLPGGRRDTGRTAAILLDEFRAGKLGRVTLDAPPESIGHDGSRQD
ncbi:MAG: ribosome biogenesis GTPase YlqF [Oscillospiraceae bacterium]|jgi:ribosome biogenesis GTPase A|nr:ribosome biogenesis GTPase YlqF [Oscillospiraceae bacterium]